MMNERKSHRKTETAEDSHQPVLFPDEVAHLEMICRKVKAAVQEAKDNVQRLDKEYMDTKRYMADYRGEIDPHEMFQNELALKQIDRTGAFAVGIWQKLARLEESPYFARIDFKERAEGGAVPYYIGPYAFHFEDEMLIVDWRAPIASMFYDCQVGPGGYDAPGGRIEGELVRKRQFKVKNGLLEYALESSVNIQDDVLQKELSHTSDEKMKSIIATLQREQNQIIRNEKAQTMIIQGVAGSGKTSIALHRIAFLLYRFKDKLSAKNVAILSPNRVFGDYISTVLPELGEEPIGQLSFRDIAEVQLQGAAAFQPDKDPLETEDEQWAERVRFKSTLDFLEALDRYLQEVPKLVFAPVDYSFGRFSVTADWIQSRFYAYGKDPIKKRLEGIAEDIRDRFDSDNFMGEEIPRAKVILKSLQGMLKIKSSLALYKDFYRWLGLPKMLVPPAKQTLEWADVFPFLYLKWAFEGLRESKLVKHLVIDEMQDYTPVQYAVINRLFPCNKTILGDFGQCINPNHRHNLEDLGKLYGDSCLVTLTKSYRSTYEILTFAKSLQQADQLEPVKRHGERPQLIPCKDQQEELTKIKERLHAFLTGKEFSLAIILKTNSAAEKLYGLLEKDYEIQLITPETTRFTGGISITSVQMSKGLEFDQVLVADAGENTYRSSYDRGLLYIACTRAMHRLALLYTGRPAPWLNPDEDKILAP